MLKKKKLYRFYFFKKNVEFISGNMVNSCFVYGCTSNNLKNLELKFHRLPADKACRKAWIIKLRTVRKTFTNATKVCSLHFSENDYNLTPLGNQKYLKKTAIPSLNLPVASGFNTKKKERLSTYLERKEVAERENVQVVALREDIPEIIGANFIVEPVESSPPKSMDVSTQVDIFDAPQSPHQSGSVTITPLKKSFEMCDDDMFFYFTGIKKNTFKLVHSMCADGEDEPPFVRLLSSHNQLFMTLYIYKHALEMKFAAYDMQISARNASKIFEHWTVLLNKKLMVLDVWSKAIASKRCNEYTCIIDCTEIQCEIPKAPDSQQQTFSHYKNRNTFKGLVGCNEDGIVMFCSELYSGSISDQEITRDSGFLNQLKCGDIICADKGFDIKNLLDQLKVGLNIPPKKI